MQIDIKIIDENISKDEWKNTFMSPTCTNKEQLQGKQPRKMNQKQKPEPG